MPTLHAHFLPSLTAPQELAGHVVVVIDILRATTTMVKALNSGAYEVIPCLEVDEARKLATSFNRPALLGGERGGLPIDGFDLGNSPNDFTSGRVFGKSIIMTTTNGTQAIGLCKHASRVLIGAFVNLSAICRALANESAVDLLCAGTLGRITREDVLMAGAVVDRLTNSAGHSYQCNDQATLAAEAWRCRTRGAAAESGLAADLQCTHGGRNLQRIGQEHDVEIAAQVDRFDIVPELDPTCGSIRVR